MYGLLLENLAEYIKINYGEILMNLLLTLSSQ